MGGTILLKCDRDRDTLRTPLRDTRDVLTHLHHEDVQHFTRMSTVDFSSLYTTIKWSDISLACRYWHAWYKQDGKTMKVMSEEEAEFMDMLFTPMSMESFRMYNPRAYFPVPKGPLGPCNSTICPRTAPKRPPKAEEFVHISRQQPETKNRPYLGLRGSKHDFERT